MNDISIVRVIAIIIALTGGCLLLRLARKAKSKYPQATKKQRRQRRLLFIGGIFGLWLTCGLILGIFAQTSEGLQVEMLAPRVDILGLSISSSVLISWGAMLLLTVLALIIRICVIPKFTDQPKGIQAVLETGIEALSNYTKEKAGFVSEPLNAYMMTIVLYLVACAFTELFSFRPPTADIILTLSLALCTFLLINYYGIKKKGVGGRLRSLAKPTPIVFPFRLLSEFAIPVSLACRLFGNMLGGMIVIHLVYNALGAFGVGIPAVLGLYFNIFHPLIQVFIFITLSLTFIGEATEE